MSLELADSYESLLARAFEQMALGHTQEAIDLALRVVNRLSKVSRETMERKPERQAVLLDAWHAATEFLRWEGRLDEAIAVCHHLWEQRPDLSAAQIRAHSLTIDRGDVEGGLAGLRQLAQTTPSLDVWSTLGAEYRLLARFEEAESCYKAALPLAQSNAESAVVYEGLFVTYKEIGRVDDMLDAWNMAVVLAPELAEQVASIYRWLIEREEFARLKTYLDRERNPIRKRFYQGLFDWHVGQKDEARSHWRAVANTDPGEANLAAFEWLEAALRCNNAGQVIDRVKGISGPDRTPSLNALILLGIAYAMNGQIEEAQKALQRVVSMLKRRRPALGKIPERWELVTSVVSDQESLHAIADYFEQI